MVNGRKVIVSAALVLVLAACGGNDLAEILESQEGISDVNVDESGTSFTVTDDQGNTLSVTGDEDSLTITGEDGETLGSFGTGEIPDDFPIPMPPGSNVQSVIETGGGTLLIVEYSVGDYTYDELLAFYDEFSTTEGIVVTGKLEMKDDPESVSWFLDADGDAYSISVHQAEEDNFLVQFSVN